MLAGQAQLEAGGGVHRIYTMHALHAHVMQKQECGFLNQNSGASGEGFAGAGAVEG